MADWLPQRLPEDVDAERSLLATLCAPGIGDVGKVAARRLTKEHFVHPAHQAVLGALQSLLSDDLEVNAISLKHELERHGTLNRVGGFPGLVELLAAEDVGRPENLVDLLGEKLRQRKIIHVAADLLRKSSKEEQDAASLCAEAMDTLSSISREGRAGRVTSWSEILDMMEAGEAFRDGDGLCGGYWGIPELDEEAPIPAGQVTFVGARPGIGKTALGTQICVESAVKGRIPLFVQLELPEKTTRARVASYFTRTSVRKFKEGSYHPSDIEAMRRQARILERGGIISPRQGTPWPNIEAMILEDMEHRGSNLVVLDYFQIVGRPNVGKGSSEAYAFAKVSDSIMAFVKDHQDLGFVLLGQLKTDAANGEPRDGHVADSDRPAKDAALTLMLWRNAQGAVWSVLHKNRDGAMGWRKELAFEGWSQHFSLATHETQPETPILQKAACGPQGRRQQPLEM